MLSTVALNREFVGRQRQVEFFGERLREARDGRGALVFVSGEAGIGKSRLVAEVAAAFAPLGWRAASGQCYPQLGLPYGPVAAVLEALDRMSPAVLASAPLLARAVAPLLGHGRVPESRNVAGEDERRAILDGAIDALRLFALRAPLLVVHEDLQWADDATLQFLEHLGGSIGGMRVVLAGTYRPELARRHPLRAVLTALQAQPTMWQIDLDPLDDADIRAVVLSAAGADRLCTEEVESICSLAEGNPFFAEELFKAVPAAKGRAALLPISVTQAILERAAVLDERDRYVLDCAALLEHGFSAEFLSRVALVETTRARAAVERGVALQLLVAQAGESAGFAVRHALTREALRGELIAAEQSAIHARIAAALEELPPSRQRIAALAHHWTQSGDLAAAAPYNIQSGDAAAEVGAHRHAVVLYERALEGLQAPAGRAAVHEKLAESRYYAGWGEEARRAYEDAIRLYEHAGDGERATRARLVYARLAVNLGDPRFAFELLDQAVDPGAPLAPESPTRFAALVTLGGLHAFAANYDLALETLGRAQALHVERRPADERFFYEHRSVANAFYANVEESASDCAQALAIARRMGDARVGNRILANFGTLMADLGERERGLAALEKALTGFRTRGSRGTVYLGFLVSYARAYFDFGDVRTARWAVCDALTIPAQTPRYRALLAAVAIPVGLACEEPALVEPFEDRELLDFALGSEIVYPGDIGVAYAQLMRSQNRGDEARNLLQRTLDALARAAPKPLDDPWTCVEAAALGEQGLARRAREVLESIVPVLRRKDREGYPLLVDALIARCEGREAECRELAIASAAAFDRASREWRRAYALETAGALSEALELYRTMGDARSAKRVERVVEPVNRRGRPRNALTARERDVARLLALGKSNRAIAGDLHVGERTVETHVASILVKLGAHNRAEAAGLLSGKA